jgi:hypothetical protein
LAVYAAWLSSLLVFMLVLYRVPSLAPQPHTEQLRRPGRELLYALGAVALLFALSQLTDIWFASWKKIPGTGRLVLFLHRLIFYTPIAAVLVWRKQGLDTCLLRREKLPWKLLLGLALGVLASVVFVAVRGKIADYPHYLATLGKGGPVAMLQTFLEGLALGFLVYRVTAWIGIRWAAVLVAALFMAAHIPVYIGQSVGFSLAVGIAMAAAHAGISVAVLLAMWKSQDIVVIFFLHWFINRASSF